MRSYFLVTISAAALAVGAGLLARRRSRLAAPYGYVSQPYSSEGFEGQAREVTRAALKYFVVPIWLAAGAADWMCHSASDIQHTTGLKESIIHLLMMAEAAAPILAALLLEIDPLILSGMIAVFFLHEATAMWDVSYAVTAREVSPVEQHVHSFLEMTPLLAVTVISLLHWPQLEALAGRRVESYRRLLQWKKDPINPGYIVGALAAMGTVEFLPYIEEAVRDWRAYPGRLQPPNATHA